MLKVKLGDYRGAITDSNKAIELDPNRANAFDSRGEVKSKLGDYKGAISDFNKAVELDPNLTAPYFNRGLAKKILR